MAAAAASSQKVAAVGAEAATSAGCNVGTEVATSAKSKVGAEVAETEVATSAKSKVGAEVAETKVATSAKSKVGAEVAEVASKVGAEVATSAPRRLDQAELAKLLRAHVSLKKLDATTAAAELFHLGVLAPTLSQAESALGLVNQYFFGTLYAGTAAAPRRHSDALALVTATRVMRWGQHGPAEQPQSPISASSELSSSMSESSELSESPEVPEAKAVATRAAAMAGRLVPAAAVATSAAKAKKPARKVGKPKGKPKAKSTAEAAATKAAAKVAPKRTAGAKASRALGHEGRQRWLDFYHQQVRRPEIGLLPVGERQQLIGDLYFEAGHPCTKCTGKGCAKCKERRRRIEERSAAAALNK